MCVCAHMGLVLWLTKSRSLYARLSVYVYIGDFYYAIGIRIARFFGEILLFGCTVRDFANCILWRVFINHVLSGTTLYASCKMSQQFYFCVPINSLYIAKQFRLKKKLLFLLLKNISTLYYYIL